MNQQETAVVWQPTLTFQPNEIVFRNGKFYRNTAVTTITGIPPPDSPWVLLGNGNGNGNRGNGNVVGEQELVTAGSPGDIGAALDGMRQEEQTSVNDLQTRIIGSITGNIILTVIVVALIIWIIWLLFFRDKPKPVDTLDTEKENIRKAIRRIVNNTDITFDLEKRLGCVSEAKRKEEIRAIINDARVIAANSLDSGPERELLLKRLESLGQISSRAREIIKSVGIPREQRIPGLGERIKDVVTRKPKDERRGIRDIDLPKNRQRTFETPAPVSPLTRQIVEAREKLQAPKPIPAPEPPALPTGRPPIRIPTTPPIVTPEQQRALASTSRTLPTTSPATVTTTTPPKSILKTSTPSTGGSVASVATPATGSTPSPTGTLPPLTSTQKQPSQRPVARELAGELKQAV